MNPHVSVQQEEKERQQWPACSLTKSEAALLKMYGLTAPQWWTEKQFTHMLQI